MEKIKISVVVTVLNEAELILALLLGLASQSKFPDELVIVDAGSTDGTVQLIKQFKKQVNPFPIKILSQPGFNRSQGRNIGAAVADHNWIAFTDAGCVPHPEWLAQLGFAAINTGAPVVAGYYQAAGETDFQNAVATYMLVMSDKVNPENFLPASRSMLIKKSIFNHVGGFDEQLVVSEDYDLAWRLKINGTKFAFADQAIVAWWPQETLKQFFQTVSQMAQFDARAGLMRSKAKLVVARYLLGLFIFGGLLKVDLIDALVFFLLTFCLYSLWAAYKNAQYLDQSYYYLPLLQFVADAGVIWGTIS